MYDTAEKRLFSNADLRKLIIPLVFEQALAITVGMADTLMVSSAGEAAISGVSLVDMINILIFSVFSALATGGAVVTSQFLGAGKKQEACRSSNQLIYTVILLSAVIMAAAMLLHTPMLRLFFGSIEDDVMHNAVIYLIISALSYPSLAVYNACAALFRSMGNSKVTLKVSILMNLINVTGNALCIYGLKMGTAGVAIPSLISRTVAAAVLYVLLRNQSLEIHFAKERLHLDREMVGRILYIGIPSGIENGIFQLGRVIVVSIISGFGTVQIAANGVANNWDSMGCIIGNAMILAMIAVIGRCVGAGSEEQIRYYTKKLLIITYIPTIIFNTCILLSLNWILGFYHMSPEATHLTWILVMIHDGFAMLLWPIGFVFPNMLRACNDVKFPMVVSIVSMFACRIFLSIVIGIHMGYGAIGVWIGMIIDWIFRCSFFIGRYLHGDWKRTMLR